MTNPLVIIGAGGFGREVLDYCRDAARVGWPYEVTGFLDDNPDALAGHPVDVPVLGPMAAIRAGTAYLIAIGEPLLRGRAALAVAHLGGHLVTLIHPTAVVAPTAHVGPGGVLCPYSFISVEASLGHNVVVNVFAGAGHDSTVGDNCVLSPFSIVTGAASLGECSFMGTHSTVTPGANLGRNSKVAAGAVVTRDADPGSLLYGTPAKARAMYSLEPPSWP